MIATTEGDLARTGAASVRQPVRATAAATLTATPNISVRGRAYCHLGHAATFARAANRSCMKVRMRLASDSRQPSSGHAGGKSTSGDNALAAGRPSLTPEQIGKRASGNVRAMLRLRLRRRANSSSRFQRSGVFSLAGSVAPRTRCCPGCSRLRSHTSSMLVGVKPSTGDSSDVALPWKIAGPVPPSWHRRRTASSPRQGNDIKTGLRRRFLHWPTTAPREAAGA